jgi:Mn2+/Fe2+ NRAMP family transporter
MEDIPSLVFDAARETSSSTNSSYSTRSPASQVKGGQEEMWMDRRGGGAAAAAAAAANEQRASTSIYGELKVKDCLGFLGPGFLITIAYVDPGNFEVDMQAGAQFGSSLLWVLLIATLAGLLVQILCVRLAVTTGKHLSQMCRHEYTPMQSKALWILSELAIIASDIPEVIGTAFALQMLFGIPVEIGILVTSSSAMIFLLLQQLGA